MRLKRECSGHTYHYVGVSIYRGRVVLFVSTCLRVGCKIGRSLGLRGYIVRLFSV